RPVPRDRLPPRDRGLSIALRRGNNDAPRDRGAVDAQRRGHSRLTIARPRRRAPALRPRSVRADDLGGLCDRELLLTLAVPASLGLVAAGRHVAPASTTGPRLVVE